MRDDQPYPPGHGTVARALTLARLLAAGRSQPEEELAHASSASFEDNGERPAYVWLAVALEVFTGVLAIPVGSCLLPTQPDDPCKFPKGGIERTVFGSYLIPGLYLLVITGAGMLVLAGLSVMRHWSAPWLTGALGVGLISWIAVQLLVMPETMFLQPIFLAVGFALGFIALFWLRRTGQLIVW